jgi:hypothetical protein
MRKPSEREIEARRTAQAVWDKSKQRDAEALKEKDRERRATEMKTERLRELRLAKEAADLAKAGADKDATKQAYLARRKQRG